MATVRSLCDPCVSIYAVFKRSLFDMIRYDILTAIGLTLGGSSTVHIYTQTIHRTIQSTPTIHRTTQLTNLEECRFVPRLCELYPGNCFTTEEKVQKNLSQGSRRMSVGTTKTEYIEQRIHNNRNIQT